MALTVEPFPAGSGGAARSVFFVSLDPEAASDAGRRLWPYRPADGHPCYFITSEFFASFIDRLDLNGKRVADVGMGSGILALAARAGAACVTAVDVNPKLQARLVAERSIFIESLIIYELEARTSSPLQPPPTAGGRWRRKAGH